MDERTRKLLEQLGPERLEAAAKKLKEAAQDAAKAKGVDFTVRFTESKSLHSEAASEEARKTKDPLTARAHAALTPELRKALIDAEPRMMAWLRASQSNVAQFAMDPVAALREAVPHIDKALLARITAMRRQAARTTPDAPGVRLETLRFEVAPDAGSKGRA
ncbi:MAG TPA: hypothetical protein VL400_27540 [Polyangiaceae bacterium]|nr:hypothetical protein [Polyangiaceae bacterium]